MLEESDRSAILETLHRYCTAVDSRNWALIDEVFLPDARVDFTGAKGPLLKGSEVSGSLREMMSRFSILQHFVSNVRIDVVDTEVRSAAYVLAVHGYKAEDGTMRFFDLGGEYLDHLVRTDAGWRVTERTLVMRWIRGDVPIG